MLVERRPVVGRGLFVDEHHDERKRIWNVGKGAWPIIQALHSCCRLLGPLNLPDPVITEISDHEVPTASCRSFSPPASTTFLPFAVSTRGTSKGPYYHNNYISWQKYPTRKIEVALWTMKCFATLVPRGMVPLRHPQKRLPEHQDNLCLVPESNLLLSRPQPELGFRASRIFQGYLILTGSAVTSAYYSPIFSTDLSLTYHWQVSFRSIA